MHIKLATMSGFQCGSDYYYCHSHNVWRAQEVCFHRTSTGWWWWQVGSETKCWRWVWTWNRVETGFLCWHIQSLIAAMCRNCCPYECVWRHADVASCGIAQGIDYDRKAPESKTLSITCGAIVGVIVGWAKCAVEGTIFRLKWSAKPQQTVITGSRIKWQCPDAR